MQPDKDIRLRISIYGVVQGVGFRPFIYRLAKLLSLNGWVCNDSHGVIIEVEGRASKLEQFMKRICEEKPPRSRIQGIEYLSLDLIGYTDFKVEQSIGSPDNTALIVPDIATCEDCLKELFNPNDRRYLYPFINCTNCGPRYSIIESIPYDRPNTSMRSFQMCPDCLLEYNDPSNRRFHAQPNACPRCGPHVELWDPEGRIIARQYDAIKLMASAILDGRILAVKGIGGFHLMVIASNSEAVRRLRDRKRREEKPFAIMFPSVELVKSVCSVSQLEELLLKSPEAPIVLLERLPLSAGDAGSKLVSDLVAPNNPRLGIMLPYTPIHWLLMDIIKKPVVATSGNITDEPICYNEQDALERLRGIADLFLVHNRPIVRPVDDSIVQVVDGRMMLIRRARGYVPMPITLKKRLPMALSVGAQLKNTIAISIGNNVFVSQHLGDLDESHSFDNFNRTIRDFFNLYKLEPEVIVRDLHPNYLSAIHAEKIQANNNGKNRPVLLSLQHHFAHVFSCIADNELELPVLGVAWDGTGYGLDGTIWGGEFIDVAQDSIKRVGSIRPFKLPGADAAIREPRRSALGILFELFKDRLIDLDLPFLKSFETRELDFLISMLNSGAGCVWTTSIGRLFDAVSAITGVRLINKYEGQAAMELEFKLDSCKDKGVYKIDVIERLNPGHETRWSDQPGELEKKEPEYLLDWEPMVRQILDAISHGDQVPMISARFHNSLAEAVVAVAKKIGRERLVLSGGCFQNRYLLNKVIYELRLAGFTPYWHQRVPCNDGGISLGQLWYLSIKND